MAGIFDKLCEIKDSDMLPMHMPGHKRNSSLVSFADPYEIDITEIDGVDNLHHPEGMILEAQMRAAKLYGTDISWFLVNGSTAGVMAAILGATHKHDTVIVARNVHQSTMNALYMGELNAVWTYPVQDDELDQAGVCGWIDPKDIKDKLEQNPHASAVIITSPTYEGIISDIKSIADIAHSYGAALIVDEAHGAHFKFNKEFPKQAYDLGADIVIQSLHKTLPALTQTSIMHIRDQIVDVSRVRMYYDMLQTTSPSYILMASIDQCIRYIESQLKMENDAFTVNVRRLGTLRDRIGKLRYIRLLETDDIGKIVLLTSDGEKLYQKLRDKHHIQLEMASMRYCLAMTSIADSDETYRRFAEALEDLDSPEMELRPGHESYSIPRAKTAMSIYEASNAKREYVELNESLGRVAAKRVCFYPPGISIVNPGELISEEILDYIKKGIIAGLNVMGVSDNGEILCLE